MLYGMICLCICACERERGFMNGVLGVFLGRCLGMKYGAFVEFVHKWRFVKGWKIIGLSYWLYKRVSFLSI